MASDGKLTKSFKTLAKLLKSVFSKTRSEFKFKHIVDYYTDSIVSTVVQQCNRKLTDEEIKKLREAIKPSIIASLQSQHPVVLPATTQVVTSICNTNSTKAIKMVSSAIFKNLQTIFKVQDKIIDFAGRFLDRIILRKLNKANTLDYYYEDLIRHENVVGTKKASDPFTTEFFKHYKQMITDAIILHTISEHIRENLLYSTKGIQTPGEFRVLLLGVGTSSRTQLVE